MNILIIEDESIAAQRLKDSLRELDRDITVVAVLDSVEASIRYLAQSPRPDLIFMDIELGDGQSFDIFNSLQIDTPVIFVTAYGQHALAAFKQNSIDYLLKPFSKTDLEKALQKYKRVYGVNPVHPKTETTDAQAAKRNRFLAKAGTRLTSVPIENIAYFYTKERQLYIKTKRSEDLAFDKCLEEIEHEVDASAFFRVNRQFIIGYHSIEKVQAWYSGKLRVQVTPAPYEDIIVSRLRAGEFKKWLGE